MGPQILHALQRNLEIAGAKVALAGTSVLSALQSTLETAKLKRGAAAHKAPNHPALSVSAQFAGVGKEDKNQSPVVANNEQAQEQHQAARPDLVPTPRAQNQHTATPAPSIAPTPKPF